MNAKLIGTLLLGAFIGFGMTLLVKSPEAQAQQEPGKIKKDNQAEEKITLPETVNIYLKRKQLDAVIQELLALQSKMRDSQMELAQINTAVEIRIKKDPEIESLKTNVITMKQHLASLERVVVGGKDSPIFKETQKEIDNLEKQMIARSRKLLPLVAEELRDKALTEKTNYLEEKIGFFKEKEKLLMRKINRLAQEGISIEQPLAPEAKAQEFKPPWEYKVVRFIRTNTEETDNKLINDLASEGWEYVGLIRGDANSKVAFKRKK